MRKERLRICAFLMALLMVFSDVDFTAYASDFREADNAVEITLDQAEEANHRDVAQEETESTSDVVEVVGLASNASAKSNEQDNSQIDLLNENEQDALCTDEQANEDAFIGRSEDVEEDVTESLEDIFEEESLLKVSEDSIAGGTIETTCADGTAGSITWDIDAEGHLTIEGCGNSNTKDQYGNLIWPWTEYAESVKSASVSLNSFTNAYKMFCGMCNAENIDLKYMDTSQVTNMNRMFIGCSNLCSLNISGFDTRNVRTMSGMFLDCMSLKTLDICMFDTSRVIDMCYMFSMCMNLVSLDLSGFDTSQVLDMKFMFEGCSNLTSLDLSGFDTSKVTDMESMFWNCDRLTFLDISGFDTSKVTTMDGMFYCCGSLGSLDISGFDTSKVTNMNSMFGYCSSLKSLDLSGFDTSKVTYVRNMFEGCYNLVNLNLRGFDMNTLIFADSADDMLLYCKELKRIETPIYLDLSVTLPVVNDYVWKDESDNEITELPTNLSTSITIKRSDYNPEEDIDAKIYGISLYKRLLSLNEGETYIIKNHYSLPEGASNTVIWTSDNEKVATVDAAGKVTAIASGNAVITASIANGKYTDICKVTVIKGEGVTPSPSPSASTTPTATPSIAPTGSPSAAPTATPSAEPSGSPTASPSGTPTETPTAEPSASTSPEPSASPSVSASEVPTVSPSTQPSASPSTIPSVPGSKPKVDVEVNISQNDLETKDQTELNKTVAVAVSQTVDTVVSKGINYNGSKQSVDLSITLGGVQLAEGTDYSVKYTNAVNAGSAQIDIKFLGDYKNIGTVSKTFTINAVNLAGDEVAAANLYYEKGKTVKPVPVLYYNGKKLRAGKDFSYDTAKISADKTLTLMGMGNFSGSRDIKVVFIDKTTETRTSLAKAKVTINKKLIYTGTAVEPTGADFVVTIGSGKNKVELKQGVDYSVEFSNNYKPGTAAAVIRSIDGSKNCYGEKIVTYKLAGTKLSKAEVTLKVGSTVVGTKKGMEAAYTGSAVIPNVTVKLTDTNGKKVELKEGIDYTVSYKKNRKKGTASVVITGIGAYTGSKTVKFKIK